MIDCAGGAVHAIRLRLRARIGQRRLVAVNHEGIVGAGFGERYVGCPPAVFSGCHYDVLAGNFDLDIVRVRCPYAQNHEADSSRESSARGNRASSFASIVSPLSTASPVNSLRHRPGGTSIEVSAQSPASVSGSRGAIVMTPSPR